jgi:TnpA family transposase
MLKKVPKTQAKVRIEENKFVLTPLAASELPPSVLDLQRKITKSLPLVELVSLLIEVDRWTGFSDSLEHAGKYQSDNATDKRGHLYAAILAQACNFSLHRMERASNFKAERLAYYTNWYLREETLRPAITKLVNFQYHQPLAGHWGGGTLSSSDGQRFPVALSNRKAVALPRYFGYGKGITFYSWTSDQNSQFGSKPIISTDRDALYVLDEFQNNETELPLLEHTTDTAGFTDLIFGLFSLLGLQFSPRIRDIGGQSLYRLNKLTKHPLLKPMLVSLINQRLIVEHWDELLRVAGSIKLGWVTASLLISKLQSFPQQNALTRAIAEYGKLVKTIFILRYYESEEYRHRIEAQLNKGEGLHYLREFIFFANRGQLRKRKTEEQVNQANCLTLVTNAVIVWNTRYMSEVLDRQREAGQEIAEADLVHLSPTRFEHINAYGKYHFNVEEEMGRTQLRELRSEQSKLTQTGDAIQA